MASLQLEKKYERKVLEMSMLKQLNKLKKNALNNMRERPLSFWIGVIAVIGGIFGILSLIL
jgi:hypothetical protein